MSEKRIRGMEEGGCGLYEFYQIRIKLNKAYAEWIASESGKKEEEKTTSLYGIQMLLTDYNEMNNTHESLLK